MRNLIIGVDGGGSSTQLLLADDRGQVLAKHMVGASNIYVVGAEGVERTLGAGVAGLLTHAGRTIDEVALVALGLSGLNHARDRAAYEAAIARLAWGAQVVLENDVVIAWAGATRCKPGLAVIAGTGCNAFGVNAQGERWHASGWDYLLADEGSAYWIALEALRAVIRAYDGRGAETLLVNAALAEYHIASPEDLLGVVYAPTFGKTELAGFARRVSACAEQGDAVAQEILRAAGAEVARAAIAVIRRLGLVGDAFDIGLTGGVFRAGGLPLARFTADVHAVAPGARIAYVQYPPSVGALFLGWQALGLLDDALVTRLETSAGALLEQIKSKA